MSCDHLTGTVDGRCDECGALLITAGELRRAGCTVLAENIPDCATVARSSIRWECAGTKIDLENGMTTFNYTATFTEPFRWLRMDVRVPTSLERIVLQVDPPSEK